MDSIMVEEYPSQSILLFWQDYLATLAENLSMNQPPPDAWGFGSSAEMADELGSLVVEGIKTATCSLLWEYEAEGSPLPKPGDLSIILNGGSEPLCLIETISVEIQPYITVNAQFAFDEGEGDRSLAYWRRAHWHYFGRTCQEISRNLSEDMPLVCERFRVLFINARIGK